MAQLVYESFEAALLDADAALAQASKKVCEAIKACCATYGEAGKVVDRIKESLRWDSSDIGKLLVKRVNEDLDMEKNCLPLASSPIKSDEFNANN